MSEPSSLEKDDNVSSSSFDKKEEKKGCSSGTDTKKYWQNPVLPNHKPQSEQHHAFEQGWMKYTTLGLEMGVIIAFFVVIGVYIDKRTVMQFPLFTIVGTLLGMTIAMVRLINVSKTQE
jgi:F0F1-type ATP synthase assembly protein I